MWVTIALIVVSILYSAYMSRKNQPRAAIFEDGDFPTADEGTPQYVVFGDCWSADWCVIAWGNQRNKKVKKGGALNKRTIGYRYFATIQMGLGRGPLNAITVLRIGDKPAWAGSITANGTIYIDKFNLFGGDEGQGGIVGPAMVLMGGRTQEAPALLRQLLGDAATGCRGVATILFDGMLCAMSKAPQPWMVRHWRTTEGWDQPAWYPEKALILLRNEEADVSEYPAAQRDALRTIHAMNGAHMLVEVATSRAWGRGMDMSEIDLDSYKAAADQLYDEGFGLCLRYTRGGSLDDFVQQVLDHISAAQFVSTSTGLLTLRLIRDDYVVADLPTFTYDSGLLAFEDMESSTDEEINVMIGNYTDPVRRESRQVRARNAGAVQATGSNVSTTRDYPGLPVWSLAQRVVERDLRVKTGGRKSYKVTLDRRGRDIEPAGVFVVQAPEDGVDQIVLRVAKIDRGRLTDGKIVITCALDVFGLSAVRLTTPPGSTYVPPASGAQPATAQRLFELSYRDLARTLSAGDLAATFNTAGFVGAVGKRPSVGTEDFGLATRTGIAEFSVVADVECTPYGRLATAIGRTTTEIQLVGASELDDVEVGSAAMLDDEAVRIEAIDRATGMVTIARGCADTVPTAHAAAAVFWAYDGEMGVDPTPRAIGTTVDAKLIARASGDQLDPALASTMSLTVALRAALPYPPGRLRINDEREPASATGVISVTWAERNAITQGAALFDTEANTFAAPTDVRYALRFLNTLHEVIVEKLDIAGAAATVVLDHSGSTTMELYAISNNGQSRQKHERTFTYTPPVGQVVSTITTGSYSPVETVIDGGEVSP
ncbi:phage tail protein [Xanthomonas campestris pv. trichodesmae]|uniref:Tip attachment protein J domain-containing protein n=2 Tax=Xanthomonas citri TaxID=346 RepID=A0AB33CDF3_XANCI|nr:phage tail protein [Xanthomonas citri]ASK91043.1 hypothetical protein XcvCFBP7111P_05605 [Xanthomonas citri pv. vignicola]MBV6779288.1 phage tail protein [Xanthomonas campestris pv. trichodesmae]MBZ3921802.1 hypothetical protein [Xanthomonas campestris pv. trichodesmae]MBZ3926402.1 hypothetical protein [Xanthomonas citri pv. sesbaniae]